MSADPAVPTSLPTSVEIFDTTLRDGAQFEGISLTVEDKLRVAEQLDWLGVRWIEGGYPQANPKDEEFFRRAPTDLHLSTAELVAFGSTRRPAGKVDVDPTLAALVGGRDLDGVHRRQELGLPRDRGAADDPRRGRGHGGRVGRVPQGGRPAGVLRRRALLRRLQGQPRLRPVGARGRGHGRRRLRRAVRHQRRLAAPRGPAHHRRGRRLPRCGGDRHPHPERHGLRGGQLGGRRARRGHAGAGHGQRLRRAHRQRQPDDGDPRPDPQARHRHAARGPPRAPHRGEPPRGRAGQRAAAAGRPVRRRLGLRPQGRPAHLGARAGPVAPPTSTSTRPSWATTPGCWCPTWAGGPAWR